jgi:hypothetical protein
MTVAQILRKRADGLALKIRSLSKATDERSRREAATLTAVESAVRRLADLNERNECPQALRGVKEIATIETAVRVVRNAERLGGGCMERLTEEQQAVCGLLPNDKPNEILEHKGPVEGRIILVPLSDGTYRVRASMFNQGQGGGDCWVGEPGQGYPAREHFSDRQSAIDAGAKAIRRQITECHHWDITDTRFSKLVNWLNGLKQSQLVSMAGAADTEYGSRLDAKRVTFQFKVKSARRIDSGREPITDSPLFGGPAQGSLF